MNENMLWPFSPCGLFTTSFASCDTAWDMFRRMSPDSNIAQSIVCGRTKVTNFAKTIAKDVQNDAYVHLMNTPFVIGTDRGEKGEPNSFQL